MFLKKQTYIFRPENFPYENCTLKSLLLISLTFLSIDQIHAQFSRRDSLQGGLRIERTCFDVKRYDLNITINPEQKSITGFNEITFEVFIPTQKFNWIYLIT